MKEYFKLNSETKKIILELKKKAEELELGNVSFTYYEKTGEVNFYINEYKSFWELTIKQEIKDCCNIYWLCTDIYRINDNELKYESGERDLL